MKSVTTIGYATAGFPVIGIVLAMPAPRARSVELFGSIRMGRDLVC
ncbi:hypothetical protein [Fibrisoma montanum]|nr:hypothetical protein [Fibrisoma montanum]